MAPKGSVVEELLNSQHSAPVIISVLVIALALNLFGKFLEIGLQVFQKKSEASDQTKVDVIRLEYQIRQMNEKLGEVLTLKVNVSKAFRAIEMLAADKWPEIRKNIEGDPL